MSETCEYITSSEVMLAALQECCTPDAQSCHVVGNVGFDCIYAFAMLSSTCCVADSSCLMPSNTAFL